jgi:hypothetical protein
MKILARSVLMLLALGFGTFGDLLDSPNVKAVNWAIAAEDGDADLDKTKFCFFSQDDAAPVFFGNPRGKDREHPDSSRLLGTSSTARYKLLSTYCI